MSQTHPALFLFFGASSNGSYERLMSVAWEAMAIDTLERAAESSVFHPIVLATNAGDLLHKMGSLPVQVDIDSSPFHFGQRLQELIQRYRPYSVLYLGAGSGPLLTTQDFVRIGRDLASSQDTVLSNNYYSADIVGFTPASSLDDIVLPDCDNDVAYRLANQAGLMPVRLARQTATLFDVDTPTDLAILRLHPALGPRARRVLAAAQMGDIALDRLLPVLRDPQAQIVVAGRVGQAGWARIEPDFACGVRVYSEERGMRASGRQERQEVRSLLGYMLEGLGPHRFFQRLGDLGQAVLLDTRVLFSHCHWNPTPADRFASDLLRPGDISDPRLAEFTAAAKEAPMPVLLGGHSLMSGGLWALADVLRSGDKPSNTKALA